MPANRKALVFLLITVTIDMIGLGIITPVAPKLVMALTHRGYATAAEYAGWLSVSFSAMLFLCAPIVGNLSDRFGRRPVLLASLAALGIDYLITALAPSIGWLFLGRLLSGMAGASFMTANACIADVTPPEKRAANFGLIGGAFSLGFIIGPALGGLLGAENPRLPFYVAAGLSLLNWVFGFFVLRETLAPENRRAFDWRRANAFGALKSLSRFSDAGSLIAIFVLMLAAVCMAVMSSFGIRLAIKHLGEVNSAMLAIAAGTIAFTGYAFATQGWQMYVWLLLGSLMALTMPALNAILSKKVGPSEQGALQGALGSIGGLTSVVAPPLTTHVFAHFTSAHATLYFPGAAFLMGSGLMMTALILFLRQRTS